MPYIRCDENCDPVPVQPKHETVTQTLSCIEYEVWNGDYNRARTEHDDTEPALKQPKLKDGWNDDYIQTQADGTQKTGVAQFQVQQNIEKSNDFYIKRDIDNDPAEIKCYVRRDVDNKIVVLEEEPDGTFSIDGEPVILAVQDDRDNIFVTEDHLYRIELESNTRVTGIVADITESSVREVLEENGRKLVYENGILVRVEQL